MADPIESIPEVAEVERIYGTNCDPDAAPALLVEVPHGADRRADYEALRRRLVGDLPADLHIYFHVNTDIGAYEYGRLVAEQVAAALPDRHALVIRCLIPRTFIDTNRLEDAPENLAKAGLTAGVPPYMRHPDDLKLLLALHRAYVRLVEKAYVVVCESGGFALSPHTYGPRTMNIPKIDDTIVDQLRRAHQSDAWATWPERPSIDLITRDPDGVRHAPAGMVEELLAAYRAMGFETMESATYALHPEAQGTRWARRYPNCFLCLEVRRDLLVEAYTPFEEMRVRPDAARRIASPLAAAIVARLKRSSQPS